MTVTRTEHDGDPWVARWTAPNGSIYELYEDDVALLRMVAAGRVETKSTRPKWVWVGDGRCTTRDPETKVFRRLVGLGVIVACETEFVPPARPEFSSSGVGYHRTPYRLVDAAAETMLAGVR